MGLSWVRVDVTFPRNLKVIALAEDKAWQAITSYLSSLAYAGEQGTDGFVAKGALPFVFGTPRTARQLVDVGLWIPRPGGWQINDWDEYQPTSDEISARSARARAAAELRWAATKTDTDATGNAKRNANGNAKRNART